MFCIHCGQQIGEDSEFCFACGVKVEKEETMGSFCIQCGEKLPEDSAFCTACGAKTIEEPKEPKAEPVAAPVPNITKTEPTVPNITAPAPKEAPPIQSYEPVSPEPTQNKTDSKPSGVNPKSLILILAVATLSLLLAVVGLIIFILVNRGSDDGYVSRSNLPGVQIGTPGADFHDDDEEMTHVNKVRNGHFINHPDITIGAAFDIFFTRTVWQPSYDAGINYVSFHGTMFPDGEETVALFIFQFEADDSAFRAVLLIFDGTPQDVLVMDDFVEEIFNTVRMRG